METKAKRTAREIKVKDELLNNKDINVNIGTVENRDAPETIYIFISFWAKPSDELLGESKDVLKEIMNNELSDIYNKELKPYLKDNKYFTSEEDNIYIMNVPENINYNNKRNFISIELYLHTLNVRSKERMPLSNKKDTELYEEAVKVANKIGDTDMISKQEEFKIFKKSMG